MRKSTGLYPSLTVDVSGDALMSHAGVAVLVATAGKVGLDAAMSSALSPWRKPMALHDPGKIVVDLAIAVAIGGDCLADIGLVRSDPAVFGLVASDPTVSRLFDTLARDADLALKAIDKARVAVRGTVWSAAGADAPDHLIGPDNPVVVDLDATLITAHSEKELAAPTYKKGFGFHPLGSWVDHGAHGTGEPLAMLLRKGNAGSNTVVDHIAVTKDALRQLPFTRKGGRTGKKVLVRTDGGGGTHDYVQWLADQKLQYSVGFTLSEEHVANIMQIPDAAWTQAYDADGKIRDGAWVVEATGVLDLTGWPAGMRVLIRAERPHPGAQLRFTDLNGNRLTAFATNTIGGQHADLELRHRRRARSEDRIRNAKDTGLRNLPLTAFAQNRLWVAVVQLATELTAWTQMLALTTSPARRWEPKKLRARLFWIAGKIGRRNRKSWLRLSTRAPFADLLVAGLDRLNNLPQPT